MRVDYRSFLNKIWEALPAAEYVAMASDPHVLGNPLLKTQHFIGSSKWEYVSETEAIGWHQIRVPHQRYVDDSQKEVAVKGHAHGSNQHWYKKIDGVWKFAGLAPIIRWGEFDFEAVFASGREQFGDEAKAEEQVAVAAGISADIGEANAEASLGQKPVEVEAAQEAADTSVETAQSSKRTSTTLSSVDAVQESEGTEISTEDVPMKESLADQTKPANPSSESTPALWQPEQAETTRSLAENSSIPEPTPSKQMPSHSTADPLEEPFAAAPPDQDQAELVQLAKEDGKLFELPVEQVPPGLSSVTL